MPTGDITLPHETQAMRDTAAQQRSLAAFTNSQTTPAPVSPHDGIETLTHKTPFGRAADLLGNMPKGQ